MRLGSFAAGLLDVKTLLSLSLSLIHLISLISFELHSLVDFDYIALVGAGISLYVFCDDANVLMFDIVR